MGVPGAVVWDSALLGYDLGGEHPLHPIRLELTMRLASALGVLDGVELLVPQEATDQEIERIHDAGYIAAVREAPLVGWDVGHGLGTSDNPVFDRMHEASARVVGSSLLAARQIAAGTTKRAVGIAGGLHHAMRDHAHGFCVYNDLAVAISWLLDNGFERIAYVDTDVHHGDGVQAAFYDDPRVLTISMHQNPLTLFPGTGFADETGGPNAPGSAVNVALPPNTGDRAWLRAFNAVVPSLLDEFQPQLLVSQCGVDTHHEDPLASLSLSVDGHRAIYRTVRDLAERYAGGRWLAAGGGGYQLLRVVPRSWTHLVATVLDRDVTPGTTLPNEWTDFVDRIAPTAELPLTMSDNKSVDFEPWDGSGGERIDSVIRETRRAVFPLRGLDPDDPRD
jgi:acetoin utilization protein AcuC